MATQYWIGDFFVDLSRNQITKDQHQQMLAPKALAVLTVLAEHQGEVVSQDALLDKVWQDTVVTPNTLQRSIAQLRKALGDDSKTQRLIKTHAKQGYSLECEVRWQDQSDNSDAIAEQESVVMIPSVVDLNSNNTKAHKTNAFSFNLKWIPIALVVIASALVGARFLGKPQRSAQMFSQLRSLTATDDKEFDATYTPDGQYIVFHRYLEQLCINKLWAKHIESQQEIQLTLEWTNSEGHSISPDGKQVAFLAKEDCDAQYCYNLMALDFHKALQSPQQPSQILQCKNTALSKPIWLSNDRIALMQRASNRWKLISFSLSQNQSKDLYVLDEGNLIDYAFSMQHDRIAVISIHADRQHYIDMLTPQGDLVSSHVIERPAEIAKYRPLRPNFDPLSEQLVFSTGRQLFTLSFEGKVSKIDLPFADFMMRPFFHPDGKRLLMIKGPYDSDVVRYPLEQLDQAKTVSVADSFERSNHGDDHGMFQPDGDLIAFWSARSGEDQVWLSAGHGPQQLTQFPLDTYIRGFDWAADGDAVLVNANGVLFKVGLDGSQQRYELGHPVLKLFQWHSAQNTALVLLGVEGITKLASCDLNTLAFREIKDGSVNWAQKTADGRLIYKDTLNRFWAPGPAEDQHIEALDGQGKRNEKFLVQGNRIYAINEDHQIWSYDLDTAAFEVLGEVNQDIDYLTDINEDELLMSLKVSAKKEVVELVLGE